MENNLIVRLRASVDAALGSPAVFSGFVDGAERLAVRNPMAFPTLEAREAYESEWEGMAAASTCFGTDGSWRPGDLDDARLLCGAWEAHVARAFRRMLSGLEAQAAASLRSPAAFTWFVGSLEHLAGCAPELFWSAENAEACGSLWLRSEFSSADEATGADPRAYGQLWEAAEIVGACELGRCEGEGVDAELSSSWDPAAREKARSSLDALLAAIADAIGAEEDAATTGRPRPAAGGIVPV